MKISLVKYFDNHIYKKIDGKIYLLIKRTDAITFIPLYNTENRLFKMH